MNLKVLLSFLFALSFKDSVNGQYVTYNPSMTIGGVGYTGSFTHSASMGSGLYRLVSPADTYIIASCSLVIPTGNCAQQIFKVSRSGDLNLGDAMSACSTGTYGNINSIGNEITFALQMSVNTASFSCSYRVVSAIATGCDCGWNVNSKIVGGSATAVNEFVSHAGIAYKGATDAFCGAVIIRQYYAVTAAHCALQTSATNAELLVGAQYTASPYGSKWGVKYPIASFIWHANYNSDLGLNDIGLVRTTVPIRYSVGVGPACIPYTFMNNDNFFNNIYLTVVGWGTTEFAGPPSATLKKAQLLAMSTPVCQSKMPNIDSTKICTDGKKVADSCGQDSGGGLYYQPSISKYVIGLVNYGIACASTTPSVNSRVTSYVGWLETNVGGGFCRKA